MPGQGAPKRAIGRTCSCACTSAGPRSRGWQVDVTDVLPGETAGIKSATLVITGENAYGYAKAERGVHRLVRISPFDANKRRHTSFASVDVIAEIEEDDEEIVLPPNEFQVDTFRSGGKGGQNVNKVETAVRITHLPTGLVVASQSQRSQHQNRATAMKLLLSRIYAQRVDAQKAEMERFYGEKGSISWGNQIRSYVFQPYRMVKDLRTGVETSNVQAVMDGDLDPFVNGWLRAGCPIKRMQGVKDERSRSRSRSRKAGAHDRRSSLTHRTSAFQSKTILDTIVQEKKREVARLPQRSVSVAD